MMNEYKTVAAMVREVVDKSGKSHRAVATEIGMSASSFSQRITNNSFSAEELKKIAEATGNQLVFRPVSPYQRRGVGERVRMMVDGIKYDTFTATAICHTEPIDGWYKELYMDADGRFYVVHYTRWKHARPFISRVSKEEAKELWEKYAGADVFAKLFE